jgi:hypothetical protein
MEKQRPTELNKKIKRLRSSRDTLKDLNREKTLYNKKLRDRSVEITTSRDYWKKQCEEECRERKLVQGDLREKLNASQAELELERARADLERERAEKLEKEIEKIREKKSGS